MAGDVLVREAEVGYPMQETLSRGGGLSSEATSGVAVRPSPVRWGIVTILLAGLAGSAHAQFSIALGGGGVDVGAAVATDSQGNIYFAGSTTSPNFPVTASALQAKLAGGSDAFIAKYSPTGTPIWATYFGGSGDDAAVAIAVGADGNLTVTGRTLSHDLPTFNAFQPAQAGGNDVFLLKLDSTGSHILYCTYLGGSGDDLPTALTLDSAGSAYLTGSEVSPSFPGTTSTGFGAFVTKVDATGALVWTYLRAKGTTAAIAVDAAGNSYIGGTLTAQSMATGSSAIDVVGSSQALVFKLAADGSHEIYTKTFGGNLWNKGTAIAVDALGSAYVAGTTWSADFPLVHSLQSSLDARPLWKSLDHGATWSPLDGLPFANQQTLVIDPTAPATLYIAAIDGGVFKSADGGASWKSASAGIDGTRVQALAIDPSNPQILYAGTGSNAVVASGAIYKSTDGAATWSRVDSGNSAITQLSVDPLHSANVYAVTNLGPMRKTSDSGATWSTASFPASAVQTVSVDPQVAGTVYAYSPFRVVGLGMDVLAAFFRSTDGAASWQAIPAAPAASPGVTIDATTVPATIYAGLSARSSDHGATWSSLTPPVVVTSNLIPTAAMVDPFTGMLYGATVYPIGLFKSNDHGQTWSASNSPVTPADAPALAPQINSLIPTNTPGTLYAIVQNVQSSAFVTELSPDGSSITASTLLHGHPSTDPAQNLVHGPTITSFASTYATAIALDPAGNIVVAGGTRSNDFPMANASQPFNAGQSDAFAAVLAAGSNRLIQSTYLGGSLEDEALAAGVDPAGNVIVTGQTYSSDLPVTNAALPPKPHAPYAFLTKLAPPARGDASHLCRVPLLIPERCQPVPPPSRGSRSAKALPE